jgi:hypothetical protein
MNTKSSGLLKLKAQVALYWVPYGTLCAVAQGVTIVSLKPEF